MDAARSSVEHEIIPVLSRAGTDADVLFAEADTAAYRAKRRGRGRAEIFDETLRRQLTARAEPEAAIAQGLAHGEMALSYQPVFDVASHRLVGYEALVRRGRPAVGLVPPDEFIPVAEAQGYLLHRPLRAEDAAALLRSRT